MTTPRARSYLQPVRTGRRLSTAELIEAETMGALAVADTRLSRVEQRDMLNAAQAYLSGLSETGERSQRVNLLRVLRIYGVGWWEVRWGNMRFDHLDIIKRRLQRDGFSPSTINATLSALKGVARCAWNYGQITDARQYQAILAVKGVRGLRVRMGRRLLADEIVALMQACADDPLPESGARDACMIALMFGAALRRAEVVALDLEDWAEATQSLHVRGKGDKDRIVYFRDGGARRALKAWLRCRGTEPGALLCPVSRGGEITVRRLNAQAVYKAIRRRAREAGTRHFSPHDLRRTWATNALEGGGDLLTVSKMMGHVTVEATRPYDMRGEGAKQKVAGIVRVPYRRIIWHRPRRKPKRGKRKKKYRPQ